MDQIHEPATRESWNDLSFSQSTSALGYTDTFSEAEFSRLALGHVPADMDDKWFAYLEVDTLYLHRSWTDRCIYTLRFTKESNSWAVSQALVVDDPAWYKRSTDDYEAALLRWLIRGLLLHQDVPFPDRPSLITRVARRLTRRRS